MRKRLLFTMLSSSVFLSGVISASASPIPVQGLYAVEEFTLRQVPHSVNEYIWFCGDYTVFATRAEAKHADVVISGPNNIGGTGHARVPKAVADWYRWHPEMLQAADYFDETVSWKAIAKEVPPGRPRVGTRIWYVDGHYTKANMTGYGPSVPKGYRLPKGAPRFLGGYVPSNLTIPPATWSPQAEIKWEDKIIKSFHSPRSFQNSIIFHTPNGWTYYASELTGLYGKKNFEEDFVVTIQHVEFYSEGPAEQYFVKHGGTVNEWNNTLLPALYTQ